MFKGDSTGFTDRKGKEIAIGDSLKLSNGKTGTVFYRGTMQVRYKDDDKHTIVMTIGAALNLYKATKTKER